MGAACICFCNCKGNLFSVLDNTPTLCQLILWKKENFGLWSSIFIWCDISCIRTEKIYLYNPAKSYVTYFWSSSLNLYGYFQWTCKTYWHELCVLKCLGMFCFKGDTCIYNPNFRIFFQSFLRVLSKINIRLE